MAMIKYTKFKFYYDIKWHDPNEYSKDLDLAVNLLYICIGVVKIQK